MNQEAITIAIRLAEDIKDAAIDNPDAHTDGQELKWRVGQMQWIGEKTNELIELLSTGIQNK